MPSTRTIALVSNIGGLDPRAALALASDYSVMGMEWFNDTFRIPASKRRSEERWTLLSTAGLEWHCFHGSFTDFDILVSDRGLAASAETLLRQEIAFASRFAPTVFTIHLGSGQLGEDELDLVRGRDRLAALSSFAAARGVRLCIENMRYGLTSEAETLAAWARDCGTGITLDLGHIAAAIVDERERLNLALRFVDVVSQHLSHVHVYEREVTDPIRHVPGADDRYVGPMLDAIRASTDCVTATVEYWDEMPGLERLLDLTRNHW